MLRDWAQRQIAARKMPGAVWWVADRQRTIDCGAAGNVSYDADAAAVTLDTVWDLASLTKPLVTATLLAQMEQQGTWQLDQPLTRWLPELDGSAYATATLLQTAQHAARFPAWRPLYTRAAGQDATLQAIAETEPLPMGETRYSDLGYLCLGWAIERCLGDALDHAFEQRIASPLALDRLGFATRIDASAAAPTEVGNGFERRLAEGVTFDRWREALIQGEVHDGNAFALGGVAGHAGLFGVAAQVAELALELIEPRHFNWGDATRDRWLRAGRDGRTVGWVYASHSEAARGVLPDDAPGHVGFTGTSVWMEPRRNRVYVLLTNRVHPKVEEASFQPVRAKFHRIATTLATA